MLQHSIYEIISAYKENKDIINAYIKNQPIELYTDKCDCDDSTIEDDCKIECATILGMTVGVFIIYTIVTLIIWAIAIYILYKRRRELPDWVIILSLFLLVFGGFIPITPIIVILLVSFIKK